MSDDRASAVGTRPNLILAPHHAVLSGDAGHWIVGGCDNQATALGLDRTVNPDFPDPFAAPAQLFLVNRYATLHPCIRLDFGFMGLGYVGRIEPELTWSAHFRVHNAPDVRLVIFNRTRQITHGATFHFDSDGQVTVGTSERGVRTFIEPVAKGWFRLGVGFAGGEEVGDLKNVFIYPSSPPASLAQGHGSYVTGVKLERGIGMTPYEPLVP